MPGVKQPAPLQAMAMDTLLQSVLRFYDQPSARGSPKAFRKRISVIKTEVCDRIPWPYLAEFCTRFLDEFFSEKRDKAQNEAALEIIMDTEIVGLRCTGRILRYVNPQDGHRFLKPVELDFSYCGARSYDRDPPTSLANYHLNYLTTIIYSRYCSDSELAVIGQNCLKLEVLKVQDTDITDERLRALSRCIELRVIDISRCGQVSHIGVNHLLSTHEKLEELCLGSRKYSDNSRLREPDDILSHLDSTAVCQSMKSLRIHNASITDGHLRSIVTKFPNLTSFAMEDSSVADLAILESLKKLEAIELNFVCLSPLPNSGYHDVEETWHRLQHLLLIIGTNIKNLTFCCWDQGFFWYQEGLDFIFQSCPNVEYLTFDHGEDTLVIPQFKNLKELIPIVPLCFDSSDIIGPPVIEFDKLINLESLTLIDFGVSFETVKSIMLDDVKFPKLKQLNTDCLTDEAVQDIKRLAKSNNIDFKLTNTGKISWYSKIMYRRDVLDDTSESSESLYFS